MNIQRAFRQVMSRLVVVESDWKFVTSAGAELTVGTPIAHLGVNATGGALWVKRNIDPAPTLLRYGGIGGSAGLSLVPSPANFSFSLPQMPSAGKIYKLPAAGRTLSLNDMKGAFVMIELAGDWGAGLSGAFMFLGGNMLIASLAGMASMELLQIPALIATSKACARFGGLTVTVLPLNVSVSFYVGAIF